ncbi:hypothetical protein [Parasedimentitalea huanghaiensis]|uniref:Uncharacterized protein n=1 Tax=Parasedimentitalea huanghaiensis TaxID=2682100 RepID=A0A6L6WLV2_9RHOB|nr:hypothetical protein [Zongyanglinia huanghaiensis]MVO17595.1 hypothetical protein [Zongyanglinia huanghaiensis]
MRRTVLVPFLVGGLLVPSLGSPCGFHNYTPQPTLVDRLLGSDEIVLARSSPNNPFQFKAYQALAGDLGSSEIPFLVDSNTRRRFALDANTAVLFARDGAYGPWQRLAFVDAELAPVLSSVMEKLPAWELGNDNDRFRYFASLIGHPDDRIHKLALRELDQADYSVLQGLNLTIEPQRLLVRFNAPIETEYKAIRVLLLGLSGDAQLLELLERGVENSTRSEGRYLGAYATALIELAGPDTVTDLAKSYLTNPEISLLSKELLFEAIALHGGSDDLAMETSISKAVNSVLWLDSRLAGAVARQFGSRSNWSHQSVLQLLLNEETILDMRDRQEVAQYLVFAQEATTRP